MFCGAGWDFPLVTDPGEKIIVFGGSKSPSLLADRKGCTLHLYGVFYEKVCLPNAVTQKPEAVKQGKSAPDSSIAVLQAPAYLTRRAK